MSSRTPACIVKSTSSDVGARSVGEVRGLAIRKEALKFIVDRVRPEQGPERAFPAFLSAQQETTATNHNHKLPQASPQASRRHCYNFSKLSCLCPYYSGYCLLLAH